MATPQEGVRAYLNRFQPGNDVDAAANQLADCFKVDFGNVIGYSDIGSPSLHSTHSGSDNRGHRRETQEKKKKKTGRDGAGARKNERAGELVCISQHGKQQSNEK